MSDVLAVDPGFKNLGLARYDVERSVIVEWRVVDIVGGVKRPTIERVTRGAVAFVQSLDLEHVREVRIEAQPSQNMVRPGVARA